MQPVYQTIHILNGSYLLDAGAESLVTAWSTTRERLICERNGGNRAEVDQAGYVPEDFPCRAGPAGFRAQRPASTATSDFSQRAVADRLAPVESDGPDDTEP